MLAAVELNDEPMRKRDEIHYVWADGRLSAEPGVRELSVSQVVPHALLRVGHILAEFAGSIGVTLHEVGPPTPTLPQ